MTDQPGLPGAAPSASPRDYPQWVLWKLETRNKGKVTDKKHTKIPYNPKKPRRKADPTDPESWGTLEQAQTAKRRGNFNGIGFVLTAEDPFVGIDLDNCVNPDTGTVELWALRIINTLDTYTEYSPSGTGIRMFILGEIPEGGPYRKGDVEMYDRGRYLTVTGRMYDETKTVIEPRQKALDAIREEIWPPVPQTPQQTISGETSASLPDDDNIVEIAMNARNGADFKALWEGEIAQYDNDESKADHHLARMIAFYAQGNHATIERIFDRSVRGQREKWRKRADYREKTIRNATQNMTDFYTSPSQTTTTGKKLSLVDPATTPTPVAPIIRSAKDLMMRELPPVKWIVQDILPEGVTLFAGKSKIRKSWLAMGLCVAVAAGGVAFGTIGVERGSTLYLALEDNDRRIQRRLGKILGGQPCPDGFDYATSFPRVDVGGEEAIRGWLDDHPDARLIIIDTLAKIRPRTRNQGYQEDYEALEAIMGIANEYQVAIIVIHHTRKAEADDIVDEVNATTGLMGGVDGFLILKTRRERFEGTMFVTGREIEEEREISMKWDQDIHGWRIVADHELEDGTLSNERRLLLEILNHAEGEPVRFTQIVESMGKSKQAVTNLLNQLIEDKRVKKTGRGLYAVATYTPPQTAIDVHAPEPEPEPPSTTSWRTASVEEASEPENPVKDDGPPPPLPEQGEHTICAHGIPAGECEVCQKFLEG